MSFAEWKKRSEAFKNVMEYSVPTDENIHRACQAAYKAGARQGYKQWHNYGDAISSIKDSELAHEIISIRKARALERAECARILEQISSTQLLILCYPITEEQLEIAKIALNAMAKKLRQE